jgi:hypothetical protein
LKTYLKKSRTYQKSRHIQLQNQMRLNDYGYCLFPSVACKSVDGNGLVADALRKGILN